ncbi:MAG: hypothetical protein JNK27_15235 [Chitinophagaceae bacterium]|nr:hypothetical protein [Chitinophagaceae bacterium]
MHEKRDGVLRNDPGMGVIRHADAGYEIAKETLKNNKLDTQDRFLTCYHAPI